MGHGCGLERPSRAASRRGGRGDRWRALRNRRLGGSSARSDARGAQRGTRTGGWNCLSSVVAPAVDKRHAKPRLDGSASRAEHLLIRFHQIRNFTTALCANLEPEDCVVQSMPDVSPTKWHLAHTTWFFETFILKKWMPGYRAEIPEYAFLFNSYYNAAGAMHRRDLRGLISRPTVEEAKKYRVSVDSDIDELISNANEELFREIEPILTLGIHHEQQHQELLITDIKHVFAQNPLYPVFQRREIANDKIELNGLKF